MIISIIIKNHLEYDSLGFEKKLTPYSQASNMFTEVVKNMQEVSRFSDTSVDQISEHFKKLMSTSLAQRLFKIHMGGFCYGFYQCSRLLFVGVLFLIGSEIIMVHSKVNAE